MLVVLSALLMLSIAAPALASGDETAADDTTDTTIAVEPIAEGEGPAVIIPVPEEDAAEQPWTARFLIPLLVVTAILLIIGVAIAYNRSIQRRYKVVA